MTAKEAEKVECLLKCPHCGEEIPYEDVSFCPKCGKSLEVQQKRTDLVLAAAILTIISAAFSAGLGYLAFDRYATFVFDYSFSIVLGFLLVGILSIVVSAFAIVAGIFMLKRKYVNVSMLGVILLLISAFGNYITLHYYRLQYSQQYGFMEIALFCEITILIFSILSGMFISASKSEFIQAKIKSEFSIGLIVFSLILLLYALSANPLLQWLFGYRAFGLGPFAMLPDMFTTLALAVLLYLTMK